ncbi:hypothetical protein M5689_018372 [Euphorbia peplus]|nr:hypothetical protein M5689_018372 [Euphorbia peplus]
MGDNENLATRMLDLERKFSKFTASHEEMKSDIKDLKELGHMMHAFLTEQRKNPSGPTKNSSSDDATTSFRENSSNGHGAPLIPKFSRLDFPSYNGVGDPLGWLYRCEQFFLNQRTEEKDKVILAAFHTTEEAQLWFYRLEQEEPGLGWNQFKNYCLLRFGPPLTSNPLGELINLKQASTVEEYQHQFQTLLARANTVRADQQVDMFTAGLIETLRVDVEMQDPPNLVTAMNLARAFERNMQLNRGGFSVGRSLPSCTASKSGANITNHVREQKSGVGSTSRPVSSMMSSVATPSIKRLGRAEMAERRAKGQCDLYSHGHKCKRLFCLLMDENDHDEEIEGSFEPEISLHAITGIQNSQTMQLKAQVAGQTMLILVDSGSIHNFVNKQDALQLGLPMTVKPGLQVTVANGEKVHSPGICAQIPIQVNTETFPVDLFVLSLDGFDMVLGVKWLRTLGPILWDFESLTMTFQLNRKQVTWQGSIIPTEKLGLHLL